MEIVETSNSVLLAPGNATSFAQPREDIVACMPRHVELKRAVPNIRALIERLSRKEATRLDEWEESPSFHELGCLEEELLAATPVSLSEMRSSVQCSGAVFVKGRWIQLSPQLVSQALVEIAATVCASDASIESFDEDLLSRCSGAVGILRHVVSTHSAAPQSGDKHGRCIGLDARKCCVAHARHLLLQREIWQRSAFEEAWNRLCPPGVIPEVIIALNSFSPVLILKHLQQFDWLLGHALLGEGGEAVRRLSPYDLPLPPAQRFQFLFKIKPRWRKEELEPYDALLCDFSVPQLLLILSAVMSMTFHHRSTKFFSSTHASLGCRGHKGRSSGTQRGSRDQHRQVFFYVWASCLFTCLGTTSSLLICVKAASFALDRERIAACYQTKASMGNLGISTHIWMANTR
jgi:hypothetical protein